MKQQPAKSGVAAWVARYAAMATLAAVFFGLWAGFTNDNLIIERANSQRYRNKSADEIHSLQKSLQAANDIAVAARTDLDSFREKYATLIAEYDRYRNDLKEFNSDYRKWYDDWNRHAYESSRDDPYSAPHPDGLSADAYIVLPLPRGTIPEI